MAQGETSNTQAFFKEPEQEPLKLLQPHLKYFGSVSFNWNVKLLLADLRHAISGKLTIKSSVLLRFTRKYLRTVQRFCELNNDISLSNQNIRKKKNNHFLFCKTWAVRLTSSCKGFMPIWTNSNFLLQQVIQFSLLWKFYDCFLKMYMSLKRKLLVNFVFSITVLFMLPLTLCLSQSWFISPKTSFYCHHCCNKTFVKPQKYLVTTLSFIH